MKTVLIPILIIIQFVIIYPLWRKRSSSKIGAIIKLLAIGAYALANFLTDIWLLSFIYNGLIQTSYYLKLLWFVIFIGFIVREIKSFKTLPLANKKVKNSVYYTIGIASFSYFAFINYNAISSAHIEEEINLQLPFKDGVYQIFNGGDGAKSSLTNYHYASKIHKKSYANISMRYAIDIDKLNSFGAPSSGPMASKLEQYEIFNDIIYSPCDGEVTEIENRYKNSEPFGTNMPLNTGNTIIIKSGNAYILLGHIQQNSFKVKVGDKVKVEQPIAQVGNSGFSAKPHLHIHAVKADKNVNPNISGIWLAQPMAIKFDNKTPWKNRLYFR